MNRAEFIATCPSARHLVPPDRVLARRVVQLRAKMKNLRRLQSPFGFVFWLLERAIARRADEIERVQS